MAGPPLIHSPSRGRFREWVATSFEFRCLLVLLALAAAFLAFAHLAGVIGQGDTFAFDRAILLALRDPADHLNPKGPLWLKTVALDITALGGAVVLTLITSVIAGHLLICRKPWAAALVAISVGSGTFLSTLLKTDFDRARPELVPHIVVATSGSFPSGHAMLSAITYLTLAGLLVRNQTGWAAKIYVFAIAVLLTVSIGASRVYLGVHWPTDVLAGWCVGAAWALLCWLIAAWLQMQFAHRHA